MEKRTYFMRSAKLIAGCILLAFMFGCKEDPDSTFNPITFSYEFKNDTEGWIAGFADYPVGEEEFYELSFEHSTLPSPLDDSNGAFKISGNNHSDDLFMFIKRKVSGLQSNTKYNVNMLVEFATNIPDGMFGVGGSPGESVYIKGGATTEEPQRFVDNLNWYRMTIDNANQSQSGEDMVLLGDFSNDTDKEEYVLKTVTNGKPFAVTSNENGEVWLIVGTDSGFEATTTIHYNRIEFVFTR